MDPTLADALAVLMLHDRSPSGRDRDVLNEWELGRRAADQFAEVPVDVRLAGVAGVAGDVAERVSGLHAPRCMLHLDRASERLGRQPYLLAKRAATCRRLQPTSGPSDST
jgi:hypothetical protein